MKKIIICLSLTFTSFLCLAQSAPPMKPFVTDYCTLYVEGTRSQPNLWRHCCQEHDLYFWSGGSLDDKKAADQGLKSCVKKTGASTQAVLIYTAVVIGGHSPVHIKAKQWGNTWGESRPRYLSLTENETASAIHYLEKNHSDLPAELLQSYKEQLNSRLDSK
ncbi:MAG: hypothetical protein H0V66_09895 [Bdellovibrionales bacterium]|nr:hypothetical protein [Bdellovibrionales bacterium]